MANEHHAHPTNLSLAFQSPSSDTPFADDGFRLTLTMSLAEASIDGIRYKREWMMERTTSVVSFRFRVDAVHTITSLILNVTTDDRYSTTDYAPPTPSYCNITIYPESRVTSLYGGGYTIGNPMPSPDESVHESTSPIITSANADGIRRAYPRVSFNQPGSMVLDPSGRYLYIADTGNHCIRRHDRMTDRLEVFIGRMSVTGNITGPRRQDLVMNEPYALLIDPIGEYLYVTDIGNCNILRVGLQGSSLNSVDLLLSAGQCTSTSGPMNAPTSPDYAVVSRGLHSLAMDRTRSTLYFTDDVVQRVPAGDNNIGYQLQKLDLRAGSTFTQRSRVNINTPQGNIDNMQVLDIVLTNDDQTLFFVDARCDLISGFFSPYYCLRRYDFVSEELALVGGGAASPDATASTWGMPTPSNTQFDAGFNESTFASMDAILMTPDESTWLIADADVLRTVPVGDGNENVVTKLGWRATSTIETFQHPGSAIGQRANETRFIKVTKLIWDTTRPNTALALDHGASKIYSIDTVQWTISPYIVSGAKFGDSSNPSNACDFMMSDADGMGQEAMFDSIVGMAAHDSKLYVADTYSISLLDPSQAVKHVTTSLGTLSNGVLSGMSSWSGRFEPAGWGPHGFTSYFDDFYFPRPSGFRAFSFEDLALVRDDRLGSPGPVIAAVIADDNLAYGSPDVHDGWAWTALFPAGGNFGPLEAVPNDNKLFFAPLGLCSIIRLDVTEYEPITVVLGNKADPGQRICGRVNFSLSSVWDAYSVKLQPIRDMFYAMDESLLYVLTSVPMRNLITGQPAIPAHAVDGLLHLDNLLLRLNLSSGLIEHIAGEQPADMQPPDTPCTPRDGRGLDARFCSPTALTITKDRSTAYVADAIWIDAISRYTATIRQVDLMSGDVLTIAGQANQWGCADGVGSIATLTIISRLLLSDDETFLYVGGQGDGRIRKVVLKPGPTILHVYPSSGGSLPNLIVSGTSLHSMTSLSAVCLTPTGYGASFPIICNVQSATTAHCAPGTPLPNAVICPSQQFAFKVNSLSFPAGTSMMAPTYRILPLPTLNHLSPAAGPLLADTRVEVFGSGEALSAAFANIESVQYRVDGILHPCKGGFSLRHSISSSTPPNQPTRIMCTIDATITQNLPVGATIEFIAAIAAQNITSAPFTKATPVELRDFYVSSIVGNHHSRAHPVNTLLTVRSNASTPFVYGSDDVNVEFVRLNPINQANVAPFICQFPNATGAELNCTLPRSLPAADYEVQLSVGGYMVSAAGVLEVGNRLRLQQAGTRLPLNAASLTLFNLSLVMTPTADIELHFNVTSAPVGFTGLPASAWFRTGETPFIQSPPLATGSTHGHVMFNITIDTNDTDTLLQFPLNERSIMVDWIVGAQFVLLTQPLQAAPAGISVPISLRPEWSPPSSPPALLILNCSTVLNGAESVGLVPLPNQPVQPDGDGNQPNLNYTVRLPATPPATPTANIYCQWKVERTQFLVPPTSFAIHVQDARNELQSLSGSCLPIATSTPFDAMTTAYESRVGSSIANCSFIATFPTAAQVNVSGSNSTFIVSSGVATPQLTLHPGLNVFIIRIVPEIGTTNEITLRILRPILIHAVNTSMTSLIGGSTYSVGINSSVPVASTTVKLACADSDNGPDRLLTTPSVQPLSAPGLLTFAISVPSTPPLNANRSLYCRFEANGTSANLLQLPPPFAFRVVSTDASLASIIGTCVPPSSTTYFASNHSYASIVADGSKTCSFMATPSDALATLTFTSNSTGGVAMPLTSGQPSPPQTLIPAGTTLIIVSVAAEDGSVQNVTLMIYMIPVYVAPGDPPVMDVNVPPSVDPCMLPGVNPCSPYGSTCHSTTNVSADATLGNVNVTKSMTCSCSSGFFGSTCDLGILTCLPCVARMVGNSSIQLLVVGAKWIRNVAVREIDIDYNLTAVTRHHPLVVRVLSDSFSDDVKEAVTAANDFSILSFTAPSFAQIMSLSTRPGRQLYAYDGENRRGMDDRLNGGFSIQQDDPVKNPPAQYAPIVISSVFSGRSTVETFEYNTLWYTPSSCRDEGEMKPDGKGGCTCPTGCYCPGGGRCWPLPGYWSYRETQDALPCRIPDVCIGTPSNPSLQTELGGEPSTQNCADGYDGVTCVDCSDSYYKLKGRCYPCGNESDQTAAIVSIIIGSAIVSILLSLSVAFLRAAHLVRVASVIVALQGVVVVGQQGARDLPGQAGQVIASAFSILSLTNFDLQILRPGCTIPSFNFVRKQCVFNRRTV